MPKELCPRCHQWVEPVEVEKRRVCPDCSKSMAVDFGEIVTLPAKSLSDVELERWGERPRAAMPTTAMLEELRNLDLIALARAELAQRLAGDVNKPMALFLHFGSAYVLNSGRNAIVTGEFGVGKDKTLGEVAGLFPREMVFHERRISPRALDYMWRETEHAWLTGKILILEDVEQGLFEQSSSLKTFSSAPADKAHHVKIVDRGKTVSLRCLGRPCITLSTAGASANNELLSRYDSLEILSSAKRLMEIALYQGKRAAGLAAPQESKVKEYLRYFEQVEVVVPFGEFVSTRWPLSPRATRELPRFFEFVQAAAALNQFRRARDQDKRVIATADDYQAALDAAAQFTEGQLSGLTGAMLETYRAIEDACRQTEANPAQTWQESTELVYENGASKMVPRRKPAPDESLRGWASTNDVLAAHKGAVRPDALYEHLASLRQRNAVSFRSVTGVLGSDRPVWFYQPIGLNRRALPSRAEVEAELRSISGNSGNSGKDAHLQTPANQDNLQSAISAELPQIPQLPVKLLVDVPELGNAGLVVSLPRNMVKDYVAGGYAVEVSGHG